MNPDFRLHGRTAARPRDHGLHAQRSYGMSILRIHFAARGDGLIRHAVSRLHEVTFKFLVENLDLGQPLAGCSPNPARNQSACGKSVMPARGEPFMWVAIRVSASVAFSIGMLRMNGGTLPGISSRPRNMTCLPVGFTRGTLQQIMQARAAEACRPHRAAQPLHPGNVRLLKAATVARTFQCVSDAYETPSCPSRRGSKFSGLSTSPPMLNRQLSAIQRAGFVHVVAHEEMRYRGNPGIEKLRRHFKIEKARRAHDHARLTRNFVPPAPPPPARTREGLRKVPRLRDPQENLVVKSFSYWTETNTRFFVRPTAARKASRRSDCRTSRKCVIRTSRSNQTGDA